MRVVVDLGCSTHGADESVAKLIKRFVPDLFFGFDPWPSLVEETRIYPEPPKVGYIADPERLVVARQTRAKFARRAAWVHDGHVRLGVGSTPLRTTVMPEIDRGEWRSSVMVPCFDFSAWLNVQDWRNGEVIVKMDIEGAEIPLLETMHLDGTDELVDLLLVEWHDHLATGDGLTRRKALLLRELRCDEVEEW